MGKTLKFGGGVWATKKGSTLAYNDEDGNFKPLPFTYTGAGKGTRVNKEGLIEVVENDRPRIDYLDSEDGVFLLEKAATNLNTYSDPTFAQQGSTSYASITYQDNYNWGLGNVINNAIVFGDNSTTRYAYYNSTVSSGTEYTLSAFIKMDDNSKPIPSTDFLIVLAGISFASGYNVESYGNNIYRVSVSGIAGASNTANGILKIASNSTKGFTISGFQVESGNLSSYIPTQGTIQTRVAETASGSGNSGVFNDSQGILYANISANADDLTQRALGISDGTSSNRMSIVYNDGSSNALRMFVSNPSGTKSYITNSFNITQNNKISIKLNGTSLAFWVNGFEIHTDTLNSAFVNGTLDTFDFAFFDNNTPFYGKTKEIAYYDTVLTDIELETLTSYRTWEEMVKELNLNIIHNE